MKQIKCNKCGYIGDESEFPKGRDFFQIEFVKSCPKKCGNFQTPGGASIRMMPGVEHPFEYIRPKPKSQDAFTKTIHKSEEAS